MSGFSHRDRFREYYGPRALVAGIVVLIFTGVLAARLWHLQMMRSDRYTELALENRVRTVRLPAPRGKIFDRNGRPVADNKPGFTCSVVPGGLQAVTADISGLYTAVGIPPEDLRRLLELRSSAPRFMTLPLRRNMTLEEASLIKSQLLTPGGITVESRPVRTYPLHESMSHVLGSLGEVSRGELQSGSPSVYRPGDLVGKSGVEKAYETYLRGVPGWERIEIDAKGRQIGRLGKKTPVAGADVYLTIDSDLQKFAEEVLTYRAGAVVAVDPDTGRILAMVSKPEYDPNLFSPAISSTDWEKLTNNPLHPLENRAIRGLYPPASTFKIVTAAAALAEGIVSPEDTLHCDGMMPLGGLKFRCWTKHGDIALHRALVESCDVYFYKLGLKLGPAKLSKYATLFGMGRPTGIELPQELPGLAPTSAWKIRRYGEIWTPGETVTFSIGQGYMIATPIQMAMMAAVAANGGKLLKPAIIEKITNADKVVLYEHEPVERWALPLDESSLALLKQALHGVVSEETGTGRQCRVPGLRVSGKTGTSQVVRAVHTNRSTGDVPYHERTHAIFVAYVDERPDKLAVAVVVEHGGKGGSVAAPVAQKIIAHYYGMTLPEESEQ